MGWRPLYLSPADEATGRRLRQKARFLLDEDVDRVVANALRTEGYNVRTAYELGLVRKADEQFWARRIADNRILLTHDHDFENERTFPPHRNPGIVILPGGSGDFAALTRAFRIVVIVPSGDRDIRALARECDGRRRADAACAAGDE